MAITKITIPHSDVVITCRNERERDAANIFVRQLHRIAGAAFEGYSYAVETVTGSYERELLELSGQASSFFYMGMIKKPFTSGNILQSLRAIYADVISDELDKMSATARI